MKEVDFYRLRAEVSQLTNELADLKKMVTNNAMVSAQNEGSLAEGLKMTSCTLVALVDVITTKTHVDISEQEILDRTKELFKEAEEAENEESVEQTTPGTIENPHENAFIFKAT